jgi:flavin-dependent dehydrogenase
VAFRFAETAGRLPGYAYNVPRDRFDATLLDACRRSGARIVPEAARLERVPDDPDRVRLAGDSARAAADLLGGPPDLVVDATGRSAVVGRLLGLASDAGDRRDAALFAHCEGIPLDSEGHVHMDHLASGWCWRIPVDAERVSLGIVVRPEVLAPFGRDAGDQFDGICAADPRLKQLLSHGRRVSEAVRYGNYQRTFRRGVGPGWALVGDAFGFVDPIFSSGLLLAMDGAAALARAVRSGTPRAFRRYEARTLRQHAAWRSLVELYYDGRIFDLVRLGEADQSRVGRIVSRHVGKHLSRVLTGESTEGRYSRWLLRAVIAHGLPADEPSALRIR